MKNVLFKKKLQKVATISLQNDYKESKNFMQNIQQFKG